MRVLFIIPGEESGNSMIFSKRQYASVATYCEKSACFFLKSRTNPLVLFQEFLRLRKVMKELQPDLIHCHYGTVTSFFASITNLRPLIITYHGSDLNFVKNEAYYKEVFRKFLSNLSALRARGVICVSEPLRKKLWWKKKNALILPMGVNTDVFEPMDQKKVRAELNFAIDEKIILFNHNNSYVKRVDIAQAAFDLVKKEIPKSRLIILNGAIPQNEIVKLLNASDCLLMCSDSEGSPTLIKEAMACNLPIVATNVGDIKQTVEQTNAYFITDQKPEQLAVALLKLLQKGTRSDGRDWVFKLGIDEKSLTGKLINFYRNILSK